MMRASHTACRRGLCRAARPAAAKRSLQRHVPGAARACTVRAKPDTAEYKPLPDIPGIDVGNLTAESVRNFPPEQQAAVLAATVDCVHQQAVLAHLSDYSRVRPDSDRMAAPEVDGPTYTSRALAMIHVALWDAYVGISRDAATYLAYKELPDIPEEERWIAIVAAAATAAMITTQELFTQTAAALDNVVAASDVGTLFASKFPAVKAGVAWGTAVAAAVFSDRLNDGSEDGEFYTPVPPADGPYEHREDPPDAIDADALLGNYAAHWGGVRSFGFDRLIDNAFVALPPPAPPDTFLDYEEDYAEVKKEGIRRPEVTGDGGNLETGIFWAYDGAYRIGLPNRLYNDAIDAAIVELDKTHPPAAFARLRVYVVANVAMADAGVAAWQQKYFHNFWRPTIGIRNDPTLPTDEDWLPFGAPQTNTDLARFATNPMFPAYPSGHATFGTAALVVLRNELGLAPTFRFDFTSAEFDGVALPPSGETCDGRSEAPEPRPKVTRRLTVREAIQENLDARVFIGVHWRFDSEQGGKLGQAIGNAVSRHFPAKVPPPCDDDDDDDDDDDYDEGDDF